MKTLYNRLHSGGLNMDMFRMPEILRRKPGKTLGPLGPGLKIRPALEEALTIVQRLLKPGVSSAAGKSTALTV